MAIIEFRQNIVSNKWILLSTLRGKRPHDFAEKKERDLTDKSKCPFEGPYSAENTLAIANDEKGEWKAAAIKNVYPAVIEEPYKVSNEGIYTSLSGSGEHEIIVLKDHYKKLADLEIDDVFFLIKVFLMRADTIKQENGIKYVSMFQNYGPSAGASIFHPHCQIIAIPILPADIKEQLEGAEKYYKDKSKCVFCDIISYEKEYQKRVVLETRYFIAVTPFASRIPFEVEIYPKDHQAFFDQISDELAKDFSSMLKSVLKRLDLALNDPDYNWYISTAPNDDKDYVHYHWHVNILPKTGIWAGFELNTNVYINTMDPDEAASALKNISI